MAPTRGPLRFRPVAYSPQSTAPTRGPSLRSLLWSADGTVATGRTGPPFAGSSLFSLACFSRHLVATTGRLPTAAACWRRAPNRYGYPFSTQTLTEAIWLTVFGSGVMISVVYTCSITTRGLPALRRGQSELQFSFCIEQQGKL